MESRLLSPSQQTVSIVKKTGSVQSNCAHKTIQNLPWTLRFLACWAPGHGNDVGETMWAEPHTSQGLFKTEVCEGPRLQPSGAQTSLHIGVTRGS